MPPLAVRIAATLCAVALTGCSNSSTPEPPPTGSSTSTSVPVMIPSDLETAPTDVPELYDDGSTGAPQAPSTLVLEDADRASAIERATILMTLFARRDVPAEQWHAELATYLTPKAVVEYQYTDPANVPPTEITGEAALTPASSPGVARVSMPTDVGLYLVIMSRTDENPIWLADRIIPPETVG